jgi:hypothetical protein
MKTKYYACIPHLHVKTKFVPIESFFTFTTDCGILQRRFRPTHNIYVQRGPTQTTLFEHVSIHTILDITMSDIIDRVNEHCSATYKRASVLINMPMCDSDEIGAFLFGIRTLKSNFGYKVVLLNIDFAEIGNATNEMLCDMRWMMQSCVHGYRHEEEDFINKKDRDGFMLHASHNRWCLMHLYYFHNLNPHISITSLVEQFRLYLNLDIREKSFELVSNFNGF